MSMNPGIILSSCTGSLFPGGRGRILRGPSSRGSPSPPLSLYLGVKLGRGQSHWGVANKGAAVVIGIPTALCIIDCRSLFTRGLIVISFAGLGKLLIDWQTPVQSTRMTSLWTQAVLLDLAVNV